MKIEGVEAVDVPPAEAWRMINDPEVLKACTPGLETLEETSPGHYDAEISLSLPAMSGSFKGSVDYLERVAPERLRLKIQGKGGPGFVTGEAILCLVASGGGTQFRYEADVQIGGQIARLGQRMISGVTKEMAGQFFEAFEAVAQAAAARTQASAGAAPGPEEPGEAGRVSAAPLAQPSPLFAALQLLWRTLLNLIGLSKRS
jgi:carbon monoxide dehydrogenase subunit G